MISCAMDAIEERKVVTCNIPGVFLQADWHKDINCHLKFEGAMVDMICDIGPSFKDNVLVSKRTGKKRLYAKLTKAVYGTLLGAILFYEKLSKQLEEWEFEPNDYDRCTFNKMVNGNQLTVLFHVDNLKCSYMEQYVLDELI